MDRQTHANVYLVLLMWVHLGIWCGVTPRVAVCSEEIIKQKKKREREMTLAARRKTYGCRKKKKTRNVSYFLELAEKASDTSDSRPVVQWWPLNARITHKTERAQAQGSINRGFCLQ